MGSIAALGDSLGRGRSCVRVIREVQSKLANRPAEGASAHLSRDGESKVRAAQAEFLRVQEIEKSREKMLGRVLAAEQGKHGADLSRGAVDGRNKNQEHDPLADRMESAVRARSNKVQKDFVDR